MVKNDIFHLKEAGSHGIKHMIRHKALIRCLDLISSSSLNPKRYLFHYHSLDFRTRLGEYARVQKFTYPQDKIRNHGENISFHFQKVKSWMHRYK